MIKIKNSFIIILSLLMVALLSACDGVHQVMRSDGVPLGDKAVSNDEILLNQNALLLIAHDGSDDQNTYKGSGLKATQVIQSVFKPYLQSIKLVPNTKRLSTVLSEAKNSSYQYVLVPEISKWSDHYTFWTGVPDKLSLKLTFYNVKTQKKIDSFTIKCESSLTPLPNQKPQDLLYQPLQQIAQVIFKNESSKT